MAEQITWESVEVDKGIPPLPKIATTRMLVEWAGASGDFNPIHYDMSFYQASGVDRPIVQGALKRQWLIQLITDWMGDGGTLKKFSCKYRTVDYPRNMRTIDEPEDGETWLCKGKIRKKYQSDGESFVECAVWVENGKGEIKTEGRATVVLPR